MSTRLMPTSSDAVAVMFTTPATVELSTGVLIETNGGLSTATLMSYDCVAFGRAPLEATTVTLYGPGAAPVVQEITPVVELIVIPAGAVVSEYVGVGVPV